MAEYSWDQIASYLTTGYWASIGRTPSSFNPSRNLIAYDVSSLSSQTQSVARTAFSAWADASGINFVDSKPTLSLLLLDAVNVDMFLVDGPNLEAQVFVRESNTPDLFKITLDGGSTYTFNVTPDSSFFNSSMTLLDTNRVTVLASSNNPGVSAEHIEFKPSISGDYYVTINGTGTAYSGYNFKLGVLPDIVVRNTNLPAPYTTSTVVGSTITHADVFIKDYGSASNFNGSLLQSYMREIGHALGLGNAGPYGDTATFGVNNIYDNDSWKASVMSSFNQIQNTYVPGDLAYLASVMPADILAIQNLYGLKTAYDLLHWTVWGPGGNILRASSLIQQKLDMAAGLIAVNPFIYDGKAFSFTIDDKGGHDTIDMSPFSMAQIINLNELQYSSIAGASENVVIARGSVIEDATSGAGNDTLIGNEIANVLKGGSGNDMIEGKGGADTIDGGDGIDTASYAASMAGVRVNLVGSAGVGGDAAGDILNNVEKLIGSAFSDILTGSAMANIISGGQGDDILEGGVGADTLDGGADSDTASYGAATAGVAANLATGAGTGGEAAGDTYISIENLMGSTFGDVLRGNGSANRIDGGAGNDLIVGGTGGGDTLIGGADLDTIDYSGFGSTGVNVSLATGTGAAGDALSQFENIIGSAFGDVLDGDNGANTMRGGAGNDFMVAGNGADLLIGGADNDEVSYATATTGVFVNLTTGVGANGGVLQEIENIRGSNFGDVLQGDNGANTIRGLDGNDFIIAGNGADLLIGGADNDTVSYETATAGIFANLTTGIGANGGVLQEIENLTGSNFGDVLIGSALGNTLKGGGGNDYLVGNAGSDALYGGADNDTFRFETTTFGNDVIVDFQDNGDKLSFAAAVATTFGQFTILNNNTTNVTVQIAGQSIVVQGEANISLTAADFLFV